MQRVLRSSKVLKMHQCFRSIKEGICGAGRGSLSAGKKRGGRRILFRTKFSQAPIKVVAGLRGTPDCTKRPGHHHRKEKARVGAAPSHGFCGGAWGAGLSFGGSLSGGLCFVL